MKVMLNLALFDIMFIAETKIDNSCAGIFHHPNYRLGVIERKEEVVLWPLFESQFVWMFQIEKTQGLLCAPATDHRNFVNQLTLF